MDSLEQRERAFENKFQHDQEIAFKIHVRQTRLYGNWVAGQMQLSEPERQAYVQDLLDGDFMARGQSDLVSRTLKDLQAHNIQVSEHKLVKELEQALREAQHQIMTEVN